MVHYLPPSWFFCLERSWSVISLEGDARMQVRGYFVSKRLFSRR
ncbi:hypothetical protein N9Z31_01875 [Pseudomonadales bacterium]|jgi:hypothetical protein|nr:hypothetical protein [Pseudomonadales bacterium]